MLSTIKSHMDNKAQPEIVLDLPWPPSVNRIWRHGKGRTYRSKEYLSWLRQADACWLMQKRAQSTKTISGVFQAEIILCRPDKRRRDSDNITKAIFDFCQHIQVIENDSLCRDYCVQDGEAPLGIRIIIKPLDNRN